MRRSRFGASLLERRQCELANSTDPWSPWTTIAPGSASFGSLAIAVSPSTSLRSMRVFPFSTIVTSPDQPDVSNIYHLRNCAIAKQIEANGNLVPHTPVAGDGTRLHKNCPTSGGPS